MGFCFAGALYSHSVIAWLTSQQEGCNAFAFCSSLLLRRLQLHELLNHSFQAFKHFFITEDKHF